MAIDRFQANDRHPDIEVPHGVRGPDQHARPPSDAQRDVLDAREAREVDEQTRRQADDLPLPSPGTASPSAVLGASLADLTQQLANAQAQLRRHAVELEQARHPPDAERERFRELCEVASEGHIITDVNGVIREANRTAGALLNLPLTTSSASHSRCSSCRPIAEHSVSACIAHAWTVRKKRGPSRSRRETESRCAHSSPRVRCSTLAVTSPGSAGSFVTFPTVVPASCGSALPPRFYVPRSTPSRRTWRSSSLMARSSP